MSNDGDQRLDALFRAAREDAPDVSRAEFAFETRVLARVREARRASIFSWAWKLTPFFAALAIAAGIWCYTQTGLDTDPDALIGALGDGGRSALAWFTEGGS
jgi:hypothetical protein